MHHVEEAENANLSQLAAFFKSNGLCIGSISKCIVTNGSNIFTDHNVLDLFEICLPRHCVGICIISHCAAAADGYDTVAGQSPGDVTVNAGSNDMNRSRTDTVRNTVCYGILFRIAVFRNVKNDIRGIDKRFGVHGLHILRDIYVYETVTVTKRISCKSGYRFGKNDFRNQGKITEGKNADGGQLASFFKRNGGYVLSISKCIVSYGRNILADYNGIDQMTLSCPRLLCLRRKVGHSTGALDHHRAVRVQAPRNRIGQLTAVSGRNNAVNETVRDIVFDCVVICFGSLNDVHHGRSIAFFEQIFSNRCDGRRNVNILQSKGSIERFASDGMKLAVFFNVEILHCTGLEERQLFNYFHACGDRNFGQTVATRECTRCDCSQRTAFLKCYLLQVRIVKERIFTNFCNTIADYQSKDLIAVHYKPRSIETVVCVIANRTLTVNDQSTVSSYNVFDIVAFITCVYDRCILSRNKLAVFAERNGIAANNLFTGNGKTLFVEIVHGGINCDLSGYFHTGSEVHIRSSVFVVIEAVKLRLVFTYAVIAEIVVITANLLKSGQFHTVLIIGFAVPTVSNHNTVNVGLAVGINAAEEVAASTLENALGNSMGVSGSGNSGAPFYNGVTSVTEGSAGITVFGAGCSLVCNRMSGMYVTAVPCIVICLAFYGFGHISIICPHFCVAEYAFAAEGINCIVYSGENALIYVCDDGHSPEFVHRFELRESKRSRTCFRTVRINVTGFQSPYTHGKRCESRSTDLGILAGSCNNDRCNIVFRINPIGSREACRNGHVVELPRAVVVEVDHDLNLCNLFNCGCNDIHIVNGAEFNAIQRSIGRNKFNRALGFFCIYGDILINVTVVAHLIASREFDHVLAVRQNEVVDGNLAVCIVRLIFNTVNISLDRCFIKTGEVALSGIFRKRCRNGYLVRRDGIAVQERRIGHTFRRIGNVGEYGSFSVVYSRGIVNRNIVDIERKVTGNVAVFGCNVFICGAISVGDIELHHRAVCLPADCGIRRCICIQIVPAGFLKGIYDTRTAGSSVHGIRVQVTCPNRIAVFIHSTCEQRPARPKTYALVGNIDPCAHANGIFKHPRFRCVNAGLHIAGFKRVCVADVRTERIRSAVNLISRQNGGNELLAFGPYVIVLCTFRFVDVHLLIGAVFKVIYNFGALTKLDRRRSGNALIIYECSRQSTFGCRYTFRAGSKIKAGDRADRGSRKCKLDIGGLKNNFLCAVNSSDIQSNVFSVRYSNFAAHKRDVRRNNDVDRCFANNLAVVNHLHDSSTNLAAGNKSTVGYAAEGGIGKLPGYVIGNDSRAARFINTDRGNRNGGAGSYVFILRGQSGACKFTVRNSGRNNDKAIGNGTFGTVRGAVYNSEIIGALCLSGISAGTAAVKVTCPYTAEVKHSLRLFLNGKTDRLGSLVTICGHQDHLAFSGDTDGLSGVILRCVQTGADLTVHDQHGINADCFLDITLILGIITLVTDLHGAVLHNGKIAVCVTLGFRGNVDAVHNERTRRLTGDHVVIRGVDACDNRTLVVRIARCRFLVKGSDLLGQLGHTVIGRIHILIGCEQLDRVNAHVSSGNPHFDLFVLVIIQDVGILHNTRSQHRIFLVCYGQLGICEFAIDQTQRVCRRSKHTEGKHSQHHNDGQNQRQYSVCVFHVSFSLL